MIKKIKELHFNGETYEVGDKRRATAIYIDNNSENQTLDTWYDVAYGALSGYDNISLTFVVHNTASQNGAYQNGNFTWTISPVGSGILVMNIRCSEGTIDKDRCFLGWLTSNDINYENYRVIISGGQWKLQHKLIQKYYATIFEVIEESTVTGISPEYSLYSGSTLNEFYVTGTIGYITSTLESDLNRKIEQIQLQESVFRKPKEITLEEVQIHLDQGDIQDFCRVGDYVKIDVTGNDVYSNTGASIVRQVFYVIGINGHNGQTNSDIFKDHVDFYGGSVQTLTPNSTFMADRNYGGSENCRYHETSFYQTYVKDKTQEEIQTFFGDTSQAFNFVQKSYLYDTRKISGDITTYLGSNGFSFNKGIGNSSYDQLWSLLGKIRNLTTDGTETINDAIKNNIETLKTGNYIDEAFAIALNQATVKNRPTIKTFKANATDAVLAERHTQGLYDYTGLQGLYSRIYDWIVQQCSVPVTSTGSNGIREYLWPLTECDIDPVDLKGTPNYSTGLGYQYPFFQNKQFFRYLFPQANGETGYFYSITPVENNSTDFVGWRWHNIQNNIRKISLAGTVPNGKTLCVGYGFRLQSKKNNVSFPS